MPPFVSQPQEPFPLRARGARTPPLHHGEKTVVVCAQRPRLPPMFVTRSPCGRISHRRCLRSLRSLVDSASCPKKCRSAHPHSLHTPHHAAATHIHPPTNPPPLRADWATEAGHPIHVSLSSTLVRRRMHMSRCWWRSTSTRSSLRSFTRCAHTHACTYMLHSIVRLWQFSLRGCPCACPCVHCEFDTTRARQATLSACPIRGGQQCSHDRTRLADSTPQRRVARVQGEITVTESARRMGLTIPTSGQYPGQLVPPGQGGHKMKKNKPHE
jgi:hypothetical protein